MLIAIPSKCRPNNVKSVSILNGATIFVPDSQEKDYRKTYKNIIPVPGDVRGITKTRNWILKNTNERWVVFIDDDLKNQGWIKFYSNKVKHKKLTEKEWMIEFKKLFELTEELNYRLFGVSTLGEPRSVYPYKPIIFNTYVTASCCGIINDNKTYYDETFQVKEDYELCLRLIKEDGGIIGARYLYWENSHWKDDGGCKEYRTIGVEQGCIRKLIKMYPGMIRQVKKGGSNYSIQLNF